MSQQIYSLPPLAAWVSPQSSGACRPRSTPRGEARLGGAGGGNRTPDPLITNQPLYLLSYASGQKVIIFKVPTLGKLFFVIPWKAGRRTPRSPKGMHSTPGAEPLSTGTRAGGYAGHPRGIAPAHGLPRRRIRCPQRRRLTSRACALRSRSARPCNPGLDREP